MTLLQGQRPEESNQQENEPYRLAKRMAALNLATVTSTPAATPPRPKANAFTADWTLGCRSETNSQSSGDDEAAESTSELAMSAFTDAMEKPNPAYSNAMTSTLKTQILSLYAYRYPVKTLQKIHEPYSNLSEWQIRRARAHAREWGPGSLVEKSPCHRVRLPPIKLDHFLDFANRPYFYQDVPFSTRKLRLSSGEKITMPNVIRKVTRSTMVKQYLQFSEEEQFESLSRSTLFRILEVREASQ
ncbi:unnamed protein product [Pocillopora meandrina]|uniref:Uncharacterized protein n=1 Tax=Pocillopora meandrina TaxID=46732 RepID=A0AAU9Y0I2_9CNID|nr:unnamed protein product [Pocillopora meandrina]